MEELEIGRGYICMGVCIVFLDLLEHTFSGWAVMRVYQTIAGLPESIVHAPDCAEDLHCPSLAVEVLVS